MMLYNRVRRSVFGTGIDQVVMTMVISPSNQHCRLTMRDLHLLHGRSDVAWCESNPLAV